MAEVIGFGGIFCKSRDPGALRDWYAECLGIAMHDCGTIFSEDAARRGSALWAPFRQETGYFAPSTWDFMLDFRVDDLGALLVRLRGAGVEIDPKVHEGQNGRFGWIMHPEGTRIELRQPPSAKMPA